MGERLRGEKESIKRKRSSDTEDHFDEAVFHVERHYKDGSKVTRRKEYRQKTKRNKASRFRFKEDVRDHENQDNFHFKAEFLFDD